MLLGQHAKLYHRGCICFTVTGFDKTLLIHADAFEHRRDFFFVQFLKCQTTFCRRNTSLYTRATFYLHYNNIDDVLDELLGDALRLTELDAIQPLPSAISNRIIENEKNIEERNSDPDALLPACQRAASNPKYRILFLDESLSHHILRKLYQMQKPQRIPDIMRDYHVTEWEAEKIFLYMLHGNFAVNKSFGWVKKEDWYHIQKVIQNLLKP